MKVAVIYCYPSLGPTKYYPLAKRFVDTWLENPPGENDPEVHVIFNGRFPGKMDSQLFEPLNASIHSHNNMGWDIGAYQLAADKFPADLMVFLGAPVHFYRAGWLDAITRSYEDYGPGLFGTTCYGAPVLHVRTTAFWCPPELLNSYPWKIGSSRSSRYDFEHGPNSFTRHALRSGFPCVMVTWLGMFPFEKWSGHEPDVDTILIRDQHIHR